MAILTDPSGNNLVDDQAGNAPLTDDLVITASGGFGGKSRIRITREDDDEDFSLPGGLGDASAGPLRL
jgi:hypothetical protein